MVKKRKTKKALKRLTGATVLAAATITSTAQPGITAELVTQDSNIHADWNEEDSILWQAYSPTITKNYVGNTLKVRVMPDSHSILEKDAVNVSTTGNNQLQSTNKISSTNIFTEDFTITEDMVGKRIITVGKSKLIKKEDANQVSVLAIYKIGENSFFSEAISTKKE